MCLWLSVIGISAWFGVLFAQAGGYGSPEEIRAMTKQWIQANQVRFAVGFISYISHGVAPFGGKWHTN